MPGGKADLRAMMKKAKEKSSFSSKVVHKLAVYTSQGKLMCRICKCAVKGPSQWGPHLQGAQHKATLQQLVQLARQKKAAANVRVAPTPQPVHTSAAASVPSDFFDTPSTAPPCPPATSPVDNGVPSDFFDSGSSVSSTSESFPLAPATIGPGDPSMPPPPKRARSLTMEEEEAALGEEEDQQSGPAGAKRAKVQHETAMPQPEEEQEEEEEENLQPGQLPKGFFDDKEEDKKAQPPKRDFKREMEEFNELMADTKKETMEDRKKKRRELEQMRRRAAVREQEDKLKNLKLLKSKSEAIKVKFQYIKQGREMLRKKEEEELEGSDSETEGDNSEELDPEMLCGWRSKGI